MKNLALLFGGIGLLLLGISATVYVFHTPSNTNQTPAKAPTVTLPSKPSSEEGVLLQQTEPSKTNHPTLLDQKAQSQTEPSKTNYPTLLDRTAQSPTIASYYDEAQKYYRGIGVEKDHTRALELFLQAYDSNERRTTTATFIGNIYASGGYGIEKDRDLAIEWYNKSVAGGKFGTYCRLIDTYLSFSDPSIRDIDKAVECARILEEKNTISWANLSYVAKAYAYAGMFDEAVRVQKEAIRLYQQSGKCTPSGMEHYEQRLAAYLQNRPR